MKSYIALAIAAGIGAVAGGAFAAPLAARALPDPGLHGAWYASRAAGVAAYMFLWLGLAGGLLMSSGWFDGFVNRGRLLAIHQVGGVAGVLLGLFHGLVLIPDGWTRFGLADVLVPFGSYYERSLSALGTISLYLTIMVSASFWFRSRIGMRMWRRIHYTSAVAYAAALWHGLQLGTDSEEPWVLALYLSTSLLIVSALIVRMTYARAERKPVKVMTSA